MTGNFDEGVAEWMGFECVSCGTVFKMFEQPDYCSGCGKPRNEQFGRSVAESNPGLTGFKRFE